MSHSALSSHRSLRAALTDVRAERVRGERELAPQEDAIDKKEIHPNELQLDAARQSARDGAHILSLPRRQAAERRLGRVGRELPEIVVHARERVVVLDAVNGAPVVGVPPRVDPHDIAAPPEDHDLVVVGNRLDQLLDQQPRAHVLVLRLPQVGPLGIICCHLVSDPLRRPFRLGGDDQISAGAFAALDNKRARQRAVHAAELHRRVDDG
eukprot:496187-Prymnesium_polylepis.1